MDAKPPASITQVPGKKVPVLPKAKDRGWDTLSNGDLLAVAEQAGFDVLFDS